jgi:hypothetical protein
VAPMRFTTARRCEACRMPRQNGNWISNRDSWSGSLTPRRRTRRVKPVTPLSSSADRRFVTCLLMLVIEKLQAPEHVFPLRAARVGKLVPRIGALPHALKFFKRHRRGACKTRRCRRQPCRRLNRFTADHADAADKRIHADHRTVLVRLVESSMDRVKIQATHLLEEVGVKLFTIRHVLRQDIASHRLTLVQEGR